MKKLASLIIALALLTAAPSAFAEEGYAAGSEDSTLRSRSLERKPPPFRPRPMPTMRGGRAPTGLPKGEMPFVARAAMDLVVFRPIGLLSLVAGSGLYVVWLPFTVPTGAMFEAGKGLVVDPFRFTFTRPVGELKTRAPGAVPRFKRRRFGGRPIER
ncbi:MAG: hypothetical protein ACE5EI_03890 [Thermodesulfobacteriota bacterium]